MFAPRAVVVLVFVRSCLCQDLSHLTEGSPCLVGEYNGTCVTLYRCPSASAYHGYKSAGLDSAVTTLSEPVLCAPRDDGDHVVCCLDCYLDETEEYKKKVPMVYGVKYNKAGPKAWRKCLQYFRELPYPCHGVSGDTFSQRYVPENKCFYILTNSFGIGGVKANRDQFPHMAILGYGERREDALWLCGGAVISERYILTAAHCSSSPSVGPLKFVGLGVLKRSELNDYWKVYDIEQVIKHPDYRAPSKYHDIALLKTTREINFGKSLLPACLDFGQRYSDRAHAPGWGRLGHRGKLAEHLMVMTLDRYNDSLCSAMFPPHRHLKQGYDPETQVCYGRMDTVVDTCEGDSGGPLQTGEYECVYYVYGVTSYGKDCGIPGNAGMYTRVTHYIPWIESIVWPDD